MDTETTATPSEAPVEASLDDIIGEIEAEQEAGATPAADNPDAGDAEQAPVLEGEEATDEAEKPEGEDAPPPATVKVKVNGEEREVSLDEALKGYSRTEDYKAKTEQLAEQRRSLESQFAEQLNAVSRQMLSFDPVLAEAQSIDWAALAQDDPAAYVAKKAAVEQRQQYLGAVQAEASRIEREQLTQTLERENSLLQAAIPQLADPATAPARMNELLSYARKVGFDDETIGSITDHRFYVMADKARQFDALQAAKAGAKAELPARKVTVVPTVKAVKSGGEVQRSTPRPPSPRAGDAAFAEWAARRIAAE